MCHLVHGHPVADFGYIPRSQQLCLFNHGQICRLFRQCRLPIQENTGGLHESIPVLWSLVWSDASRVPFGISVINDPVMCVLD